MVVTYSVAYNEITVREWNKLRKLKLDLRVKLLKIWKIIFIK